MKPTTRNRTLLAELKKARAHLPPTPPAEPATPEHSDLSGAMGVGPTGNVADGASASPAATPKEPGDTPAPASAPELPSVQPQPATAARAATAPAPAPGASSDAEAQDPAWPSALAAQTGADRWERGALLAALAASLPPDFPAIRYGQEEICARGVYRAVSRSRGGTAVRLTFPGGTREFSPARGSAAYRRWLDHLSRHVPADVHRAASRLCCTELVEHLESFQDHQREAWVKAIDPAAWAPAE